MQIRGWIVDIESKRTFAGEIHIEDGRISAVENFPMLKARLEPEETMRWKMEPE